MLGAFEWASWKEMHESLEMEAFVERCDVLWLKVKGKGEGKKGRNAEQEVRRHVATTQVVQSDHGTIEFIQAPIVNDSKKYRKYDLFFLRGGDSHCLFKELCVGNWAIQGFC